MDPEQVGAGSVGSPRGQTPQVLPESCSSPRGRPASRGHLSPQVMQPRRIGGCRRGCLVPRAGPRPVTSPPASSTHVSLHKRPHEAAVHGSSGRARPRSALRRPAQRSHGLGPECGRAPPPRSRPGRAARCGGWPRPLSAHARPGPRRPAQWWPLGGGGRELGLLAVGLQVRSPAVRRVLPLLCSCALLLCSALLPGPLPAVPLSPASRRWVPALTSRARVSMRPTARGPRPGTLALAHLCTRALGPFLPSFAGPSSRSRGKERTQGRRAGAGRWIRLPVASASGADSELPALGARVAGTVLPAWRNRDCVPCGRLPGPAYQNSLIHSAPKLQSLL